MKKLCILSVVIIILLSACTKGAVKSDVPDTTAAKATQAIVQQYIAANQDQDADLLISLYSDELVWMDYGLNDGPSGKGNISFAIREAMGTGYYEVQFKSYLVTPDGRFAVLQGTYSQAAKSTGKWIYVPAYVVLEFKDSLIVTETWYYDGSVFH